VGSPYPTAGEASSALLAAHRALDFYVPDSTRVMYMNVVPGEHVQITLSAGGEREVATALLAELRRLLEFDRRPFVEIIHGTEEDAPELVGFELPDLGVELYVSDYMTLAVEAILKKTKETLIDPDILAHEREVEFYGGEPPEEDQP